MYNENNIYSQSHEEEIALKFFNGEVGTVLDIGANDGKTLSNSLRLIELGWYGIMVEPSPKAFERLNKLHKDNNKVAVFNYAIDEDGESVLHESGGLSTNRFQRKDISLVSTLLDKEVKRWDRWTRKGKITWEDIKVKTWSFKTLLENSPFKKFDYITIDTEGKDFDILKQMDLKELGCRLLCVEVVYQGDREMYVDYLTPLGYTLCRKTKDNIFFKNDNIQ